jgi:hypothetical protein
MKKIILSAFIFGCIAFANNVSAQEKAPAKTTELKATPAKQETKQTSAEKSSQAPGQEKKNDVPANGNSKAKGNDKKDASVTPAKQQGPSERTTQTPAVEKTSNVPANSNAKTPGRVHGEPQPAAPAGETRGKGHSNQSHKQEAEGPKNGTKPGGSSKPKPQTDKEAKPAAKD